jgi:hypothetical protein
MNFEEFCDRFTDAEINMFIKYTIKEEIDKWNIFPQKAELTKENVYKFLDKSLEYSGQIWGSYGNIREVLTKNNLYNGNIAEIDEDIDFDEINWDKLFEMLKSGKIDTFSGLHTYCDYITVFMDIDNDGISIVVPFLSEMWEEHLIEDFDTDAGQPFNKLTEEEISKRILEVKNGNIRLDEKLTNEIDEYYKKEDESLDI